MKSTTGNPSAQKQSKPTLWADRVPLSWKPYVQLTRIDLFAGSLMIFWPYGRLHVRRKATRNANLSLRITVWTLPLVRRDVLSHYSQYVPQAVTWLVWSIILHSVGSTWNDICDVDFDRQVGMFKIYCLCVPQAHKCLRKDQNSAPSQWRDFNPCCISMDGPSNSHPYGYTPPIQSIHVSIYLTRKVHPSDFSIESRWEWFRCSF